MKLKYGNWAHIVGRVANDCLGDTQAEIIDFIEGTWLQPAQI